MNEFLTKVTSCRVKLYAGVQEQECNRILFNEEVCHSHLVKQLHNLHWIESRYHLFLLISVLLIFLLTSTYWALVRDLVDTPMKVITALLEHE